MRPLIQLPRNAHITCERHIDLIITNHETVNYHCLLDWLFIATKMRDWKNILSQLISQGFKLDAVIGRCTEELLEAKKIDHFFLRLCKNDSTLNEIEELLSGDAVIPITREFEKKLKTCNSWGAFYNIMQPDRFFLTDMKSRIMEKIIQCRD